MAFTPQKLEPTQHKTLMKSLNNLNADKHSDLFDYSVIDQNNESLGTVHSMWTNHDSGQLEFLGVKTGWLFGSNHVVPVGKAQFDEAQRTIQVPYTLALVKDAPAIDADAEITDEQEAEIFRYYGGARSSTTTTSASTASTKTTTGMTPAATGLAASATSAAATTGTTKADDNIEVALHEEQVKVGKRTVDAGAVRLRKIVRTEIVNQPVEVRHEDFVVERVSADQVKAGAGTSDFQDETIEVPMTREEVVVSKEAHVTGAVRVNKTTTAETQNVSETVRKEDVEVVRDGKTVTKADERIDR